MFKGKILAMFFALIWAGSVLAAGPDLEKASQLMKQGKAGQAYALLLPYEFEMAGNVRYDYLLGIAALDSGNPAKATFVLERVLSLDPNHAGARLDMARAYYQLGNLERAKKEFTLLLGMNPPTLARTTIHRYLAAIASREKARQTGLKGYVEGVWGHDDNINNAASQSQIAVPAFGNLLFTLNPTSRKTGDGYFGVNAGMQYDHRFNPDLGVHAGASTRNRSYFSNSAFNSQILDESVALGFGPDDNEIRAGVAMEQYDMGSNRFMNMDGVTLSWRHAMGPSDMIDTGGQFFAYRFPAASLAINGFNQETLSAGWVHVTGSGKGMTFASIFAGQQQATNGRADGSSTLAGIRTGAQYTLRQNLDFFASFGFMSNQYDKQNAAFLATRRDTMADASMGLDWHLNEAWSLSPRIDVTRNQSDIVIYRFDMTDVSLVLHRDFR